MIRINLIAERRSVKAVSKGFQTGQKITVIGSLLVVLTLSGVGWRYWALGQQQAQVARDLAAAQREEHRLAEILKQVAAFEVRKQQLEQRVALIDELRKGQNAPVHMVDQISRALPDFIGNLEASRYFVRPVEIVDSVVVSGDGKTTPDLIQFTIRGTFQMAGIDPLPPPTGRKGGKRG